MGIYFSRVIWCSRNLWYMTGIYHDLYWYITRILSFLIHWGFVINEIMRLPPQVRTSMHRCIRRQGTDPSKACFTEHSYIQVYVRYIHVISFSWTLPSLLQLHAAGAFGPAGSPKRVGTFQTWTFYGSFRFCDRRPEATNSRLGPAQVTPQYKSYSKSTHWQ